MVSGWAMPRAVGPMTIPRPIRNTTSGISRRPDSSLRIGDKTATNAISTSVSIVDSDM